MVSKDPVERLGVYKSLADVPQRYRLESFAGQFDGADAWEAWNAQHSDSKWKRAEARRVRDRWEEHMAGRGRHPALATPADVETFVAGLLEEVQIERVYKPYWLFLKRFYKWLKWRTEYPHRYNPVLIASANEPAAGEVWDHVMSFDRESFA